MKDQKLKIILHFALSFCILIFAFCILASEASAGSASLYLSPSTGNYTVNSTFSIVVKVNSGGAPINAAEGSLIFNPDELNVVSISKTDSIFTLWAIEPVFCNSTGTIEFGGGTLTSFDGSAGTLITITFQAKEQLKLMSIFYQVRF